ncbi:MAG: hypothetical protein RIS44_1257 [Pseudomonadota bacterium]|jgi:hypothetical protein
MEIKKPPTLQESSTPPVASTPLGGDWLHEIKQWYFTGSRRLAQERQPGRFVVSRPTETSPQDADPEVGNRRPE